MEKRFLIVASLFIGATFFSFTDNLFLRPIEDFKNLIFYSGLSIFCLYTVFQNKEKIRFTWFDWWGLYFFSYGLINILISPVAVIEGAVRLSEYFLLYLTIRLLSLCSQQFILSLVKIVLFFGIISILMGLFQIFETKLRHLVLPIGHVSYYSDVALLLIPWLSYFGWRQESTRRYFIWGCIILCSFGIGYTATRTPLLAGLLVTVILLLTSCIHVRFRKNLLFEKRSAIIFSLVLLIAIISVFSVKSGHRSLSLGERLLLVVEEPTGETSTSGRISSYQRTWSGIQDKPILGWGYGNYQYVYPRYLNVERHVFEPGASWWLHPHNEVLFQWFEGGLIGFIFLGVFLIISLRKIIKKLNNPDNSDPGLSLATLLSLIAMIICVQFDTASLHPVVRLIAIFPCALVVNDSNNCEIVRSRSKAPITITLALIIMMTGFIAIGDATSSYLLRTARNNVKKGEQTNRHYWASYLSPKSFNTLYTSSYIDIYLGDYNRAQKSLREAMRLYPEITLVHHRLADLLYQLRRYKDAAIVSFEGLKRSPHYRPLQEIYQRSRHFEK